MINLNKKIKKKTDAPKVSVIIPVYNTGMYLRECLNSIVNQSLREIEIICIDDGSTDDSSVILKEFANIDNRIQVHRQKNKGLAATRNVGISKSKGKYIYFIDSDDILKQEALKELVDFAEREETDVVFFDSEVIYDNDEAYQNRKHITENYYLRTHDYSKVTKGHELFATMMCNGEYRVSACLQMISSEHIKKNKLCFYEGIHHEDVLFSFFCIMQANKAAHVKNTYYIRRVRTNSIMTGQNDFRNFYGYLVDYIYIKSFTSKKDYPDDTKLQVERLLNDIKNALIAMYTDTNVAEVWFDRLTIKENWHASRILGITQNRQQIVKRILPAVVLACIISFFTIYMVYMGTQNSEFNMDEMFSMMDIRGGGLGRPYEENNFFNTWHNAAELESTIGVTSENALTGIFEAKNLYFSLLHIAYSFSPDEFTIWPSLILNIIFLNGSLIVIYMISRLIIDNKILAALPCIVWGFSSSAVNLTLLIRFYCFKTFICLLLTYILFLSVKNGFNKSKYFIGIVILMYIGFYTHQYFFVFAFFLSVTVCLFMLINKQVKPVLKFFVLLTIGFIIYSIISNNYAYRMLTDTEGRGKEAIENLFQGGSEYTYKIQQYLSVISDAVFAGINIYIIITVMIMLILTYTICSIFDFTIIYNKEMGVRKCNKKTNKSINILKDQKVQYWIIISGVCVLYFLFIARIAPYQHYRYISCITPLITVLFVSLAVNTLRVIGFKQLITVFAMLSIVCSLVLITNQRNLNLYGGATSESVKNANEALVEFHHLPVVAITDGWDTAYFYWRIFEFEDSVLFVEPDNIDMNIINEINFDDGFILIFHDTLDDTIISDIINTTDMSNYTYVTNVVWHSVYYLV